MLLEVKTFERTNIPTASFSLHTGQVLTPTPFSRSVPLLSLTKRGLLRSALAALGA